MSDLNQPSPTPDVDPAVAAKALKTLAASLMAAPVMIGFALFAVLGSEPGAFDAHPLAAVFLLGGVVLHFVLNALLWRRIPAVEPGLSTDETWRRSFALLQPNMLLRFALSEALLIIAVAAAFVVSTGGLVIYLAAAIATLALMWVHVYPREAVVRRTQERLDADGARTGLAEAFGFSA